jgi:hypothetical protein
VRTEELADDGGGAPQGDDVLGSSSRRHLPSTGPSSRSRLRIRRVFSTRGLVEVKRKGKEWQAATASAAARCGVEMGVK